MARSWVEFCPPSIAQNEPFYFDSGYTTIVETTVDVAFRSVKFVQFVFLILLQNAVDPDRTAAT